VNATDTLRYGDLNSREEAIRALEDLLSAAKERVRHADTICDNLLNPDSACNCGHGPLADAVRRCDVLDGQELALEGEDDKAPLETTGP